MWDACEWGWGWGPSGWGMGLMGLLSIALLVALVVIALRWALPASRGLPTASHAESPLEVLKKRYARGEINTEEFGRIKRDIE